MSYTDDRLSRTRTALDFGRQRFGAARNHASMQGAVDGATKRSDQAGRDPIVEHTEGGAAYGVVLQYLLDRTEELSPLVTLHAVQDPKNGATLGHPAQDAKSSDLWKAIAVLALAAGGQFSLVSLALGWVGALWWRL